MIEMQPFLHLSHVLAESYNLLKELQDYELEKCRDLMKSISETQLKVLKKISFMAKLRRTPFRWLFGDVVFSVWCLREMVKSENKKLLDLKKQLVDAEEDIRGFVDRNMTDDMPVLDEVVFKIHKNGYFELDPLRYVNGSVSSVSAFTCDRDIFPACLNWILSSILENKWALFYCLPNKSLEKGLKLIHTDNDVHSFFADAERRGKIHLYVTHKQQALGKFYLKNMVWLEEDASLRCSSSSPFSTRIKRKSHKTTKECGRKNLRGKEKMVDDEPLGRKLLKTSRKGKEKMDEFPDLTPIKERKYCDDRVGRMSMQTFMNELGEFPDLTPTKEREVDDEAVGRNSIRTRRKGKEIMAEFSGTPANEKKVVVTNYRIAIINGKSKIVEVADVHLGEGLTIVEDDGDMKKLYVIVEKYGLVNLYIAHIPENLAEYYFKNLTLDASDEEVKSKVKSHEKRKLHASAMSPHELVEWAKQEAADEIVLHDNWKYEGLSIDGPIDVGGPNDVVPANIPSMPLLLMKKGRNKVTKQGSLLAGSSNTEDKYLGSMSSGSSNTDDRDLEKSN
ncbi:hypothetical protein Tco_0824430 [Tanacetum coccineum]|uniref:PB1-like domain-containing protein n=1 Tax=Tanacetum coccineum TaxID=301880 RepID=A0ABQ5AKS1_9ASTR